MSKRNIISLISVFICLTLILGCTPIKIMSFNIRHANKADEGLKNWESRKDEVSLFIIKEQPDVMCMQEVLPKQLFSLQNLLLNNYSCISVEEGNTRGGYNIIFFNNKKFNILDSGHYWLSETPEINCSIGWNAKLPRMVIWAKFQSKQTRKQFVVINTHLDHEGDSARKCSIKLLLSRHDFDNEKVIVTGDFNTTPNSDAYLLMVNNPYKLSDSFKVAKERSGVDYSYHGFGKTKKRVDYIFVSQSIKVDKIDIPYEKKANGRFLSDHNPITVYLKL